LPPYHYGLILKKRENPVRRANAEASLRSPGRKRGR
jgi:hypothetical protein